MGALKLDAVSHRLLHPRLAGAHLKNTNARTHTHITHKHTSAALFNVLETLLAHSHTHRFVFVCACVSFHPTLALRLGLWCVVGHTYTTV